MPRLLLSDSSIASLRFPTAYSAEAGSQSDFAAGKFSAVLTGDLSFSIMGERKVTDHLWEVIMAKDTKERILAAALDLFAL